MVSESPRPSLDRMIGSLERGQSVDIVAQEHPLDVRENFISWAESESLTVSSTAVAMAEGLRVFDYAFITVEVAPIRFWLDGSIPTASVGIELLTGEILELAGTTELSRFRAIRRDSSDATLRIMVGSAAQ